MAARGRFGGYQSSSTLDDEVYAPATPGAGVEVVEELPGGNAGAQAEALQIARGRFGGNEVVEVVALKDDSRRSDLIRAALLIAAALVVIRLIVR